MKVSENTAFIYSGLGSISREGRGYLKNVAQSLTAIQSRPGGSGARERLPGNSEGTDG